MVVNRAALARFPAQNEAFEICAFVDEIPGVLLLGEKDMWFNFRTIYLQSGYESPEVRKLHFPRGVPQFIDCADEIHYFYLKIETESESRGSVVGLDLQLEYWDQVGPRKCFAHPVNVERLRRWLKPVSRILDYGCGYGRASGILRENGFTNLVGFDPAPAMIAAARARFPAVEFQVLSDFRKIPLPDASADAALVLAVLTCIPGDDAQRAIVDEMTRVLRPGGLLYISDMWLQNDTRNTERYARDARKYGTYGVFDLTEGVTVRHHDRNWTESLLARYECLALDEIAIQTMNGHAASGFQWFGTTS